MKYKQLTFEQRIEIYASLKAGYNQTKIAESIGVSKSTISREIKRNAGKKGYRPKQANQKAQKRKHNAEKHIRFSKELQNLVIECLQKDWSPEQISGWLTVNKQRTVSHETIYQFIIQDYQDGGDLFTHLRQGKKKRRKRIKSNDLRGQIPDKISIDKRPDIVDNKERIGDWEIDTIIGKNHKGALVTAVERKTKFTCIGHVPKKEADLVTDVLIKMLSPYKNFVLTITSDNGKEFAKHHKIAETLETEFYFAHPYCSWERGLNENTNGLIRQYFPKKTSLVEVNKEQIDVVQNKLNFRPRKSLDFQMPATIFLNHFVALIT